MLRTSCLCLLILVAAVPATWAAPINSCIDPTETINARIVRVEINGVLVLDDGRAVHLEGIRLPNGVQDRASAAFATQALEALRAMTRDSYVTLAVRPPEEDRYGRLRAQAFLDSGWLQTMMLKKGLARVDIMPARTECASQFYAAEGEARLSQRGLWADRAYAVRTPDDVSAAIGTFQVVEGKVLSADVKGSRAYLNFGTDWKTDFTATIDPEDMKSFKAAGVDPASYAGHTVRIRGLVQRFNGPEIEIASPAQIEALAKP